MLSLTGLPYCRERLLAEGRNSVQAVRHRLSQEQSIHQIKAAQLKAACWDIMIIPQAELTPVAQRCLTAGLGEHEPWQDMLATFAAAGLGPVQNMPIRKLSAAEAKRLQQVMSGPVLQNSEMSHQHCLTCKQQIDAMMEVSSLLSQLQC